MGVADDVKQAVQAFLVPELDAIKAQISEVRGVHARNGNSARIQDGPD